MNIRTVQNILLMRKDVKDLLVSIVKKIRVCEDERSKICKKYVEDTGIKNYDHKAIVDKNLLVYLLLKHGINLRFPLVIGNFKINCHSKSLIRFNGKQDFDINTLIETLNNYSDPRLKVFKEDVKKYFKDFDYEENVSTLIYKKQYGKIIMNLEVSNEFECKEDDTGIIRVDDEDYIIELTIESIKSKKDELAKLVLNSTSDDKSFEFNLYSITMIEDYSDEKFMEMIDRLYDGIYKEVLKGEKRINEQLQLLKEFGMV